jgi:DNA primase
MSTWIDFRALRERLDFNEVLAHYNVSLKTKGDQAQGFCPLPSHDGQKKSASFSVNLAKKIFQCFGCGAKGNVLDFACIMEGFDPRDFQNIRKVALQLRERFGATAGDVRKPSASKPKAATKGRARQSADTEEASDSGEEFQLAINAPLDFELKNLDPQHAYLSRRGFTVETVTHFGLGYCSRGLLKDRIAIPIHDDRAKLIGYAGRLVDDRMTSDENPKYRFPSKRQHNGIVHEFRKSLLVYNGHAVNRGCHNLVIVEGFASVWWLWQHSYPNVVALMGWSCSAEQAKLIVDLVHPGGCIWVLPDGDDAGVRCAQSVLSQVAPHRFARWVRLVENRQPTDCDVHELDALLSAAAGAEKSGTSQTPHADPPIKTNSEKAPGATAAVS